MTPDQILSLVRESGVEQIRVAWCDLHGELRAKSLLPQALKAAFANGVGMVGTLALKDTSDRTAFKVFDSLGLADFPALHSFAQASNCTLRLLPESFQLLPWADKTAWIQGELCDNSGVPILLDTRSILRQQITNLSQFGYEMQCGLEMEFHIYKIENDRPQTDPELAAWPGLPPAVSLIHPGYRLLSERWLDACEEPLAIMRRVCAGLNLPLNSLEIEFGPSQVEAVFAVQDALSAADTAVLFRSAVTQALRRAGYHASFMCRPPFEAIMSSGWHLHQSLKSIYFGGNAFAAPQGLSEVGQHWLAGLLAHSPAICALANPGMDAYARFRPNTLAPTAINWGMDARSALLRVISAGTATRIENRIGSPMANPYLYIASQILAGLSGLEQRLPTPTAMAVGAASLPPDLPAALVALQADAAFTSVLGRDFVAAYAQIKRFEHARYAQAADPVDWLSREYFSRF